jgi:oxygen-dependent protoporphyrinogen oxidase
MDKYIFPNRNGIRVMIGGARFSEVKNLTETEILDIALKDLEKIIKLKNPKITWLKIHKKAIPNYALGHKELVKEIFNEAKKYGIYLTGNAYNGVSFNDCIKNSYELAIKLKGK